MKSKALLTAVLLAATNSAWPNGGLSVDNVEKHMNVAKWTATETGPQKITTQGAIHQFNVVVPNRNRAMVDTNQLRHSYDGRA